MAVQAGSGRRAGFIALGRRDAKDSRFGASGLRLHGHQARWLPGPAQAVESRELLSGRPRPQRLVLDVAAGSGGGLRVCGRGCGRDQARAAWFARVRGEEKKKK